MSEEWREAMQRFWRGTDHLTREKPADFHERHNQRRLVLERAARRTRLVLACEAAARESCIVCGGKGHVGDGMGTGKLYDCDTCNGLGTIEREESDT